MRRLLPAPAADVSPADAYADASRRRHDGRPWVIVGMVASVDGATALDGRSGDLGGTGDKAVFSTLRSLADVVLVGAGTARTERYGAPRRAGLRIAVVSRSGNVDAGTDLFSSGAGLAVVPTSAPVAPGIPTLRAGDDDVDLPGALAALDAEVVVAEGGPSLNGQLVAHGLVDELCVTTAPWLVGGSSARLAVGDLAHPQRFTLVHVLEEDGELYLRYVRDDLRRSAPDR